MSQPAIMKPAEKSPATASSSSDSSVPVTKDRLATGDA